MGFKFQFLLWLSVCSTAVLGVMGKEPSGKKDTAVRICTYNIRGDFPVDGVNVWAFRRDSLCGIIRRHGFDVVCMQEAMAGQLADVERMMPEYGFVGIRGLYNPIFYRKERFELFHNEVFWLSETMAPYEKGWDGRYERYCIWAKFKERATGREFYVFNTHLDHKGIQAKEKGATLVCRQAMEKAGHSPLFICGDMNSVDTTQAYRNYVAYFSDARQIARCKEGPEGTAHNFGKVKPVRIDYIFVNDSIGVDLYGVDGTSYPGGRFPSDHNPVYVEARLK